MLPRFLDSVEGLPNQFLTDAFLTSCSAAGMIRFESDGDEILFLPNTRDAFDVSNEAMVQFLFANPHIEGERKLALSAANVTPQLFKRLVEVTLQMGS